MRFINNDWALVGVGDMTNQGSLASYDWGTFFGYYALNALGTAYECPSISKYADVAWYRPGGALESYNQPAPPPLNGITYVPVTFKFKNNASIVLGLINGNSNTIDINNVGVDWFGMTAALADNCWGSYKTDPNTGNGLGSANKGNILQNAQDTLLKIFPNPSADIFNISNPSKSPFNYRIYNIMGQVLGTGNIGTEKTVSLTLDYLANGCYTLVLEPMDNTGQRQTFRLIKNNE